MNIKRVKTSLAIGVVSCLLALTGCTNMQPSHGYVIDSQKVYQVQQAARTSANHVDIIWVNPPKKRVEKK